MDERKRRRIEKEEGWTRVISKEDDPRDKVPPRLASGRLGGGGLEILLPQREGRKLSSGGVKYKDTSTAHRKPEERTSFVRSKKEESVVVMMAGRLDIDFGRN